MSQELRCDICDGKGDIWQLRPKYRLFQTRTYVETYTISVDICDVCLKEVAKKAKKVIA